MDKAFISSCIIVLVLSAGVLTIHFHRHSVEKYGCPTSECQIGASASHEDHVTAALRLLAEGAFNR